MSWESLWVLCSMRGWSRDAIAGPSSARPTALCLWPCSSSGSPIVGLEALHQMHLPVANAEALHVLQEEVRAREPEFKELRDSLARAAAVARVTLNARAVAELEQYEIADAVAANTSGLYEELAARRGAAMNSSDRLVEIARDELGLRKLPRRQQ